MREQAQYTGVKGMNQDMSISKYSPEFTFKNYNVSITAKNDSSLFTITNTKGNKQINIVQEEGNTPLVIKGTVINYTVVGDYLVLFTTTRATTNIITGTQVPMDGVDRIYRLKYYSEVLKGTELFTGNLNFATDALIESIGIVESEAIIKVYWVDKNNQPRFINILSEKGYTENSFNFCPELELKESYTMTKAFTGGQFHSGVIQYAFSYWNLNGVESNLFLSTDLSSISNKDRAGSPEDIHTCSFQVTIDNIDKSFDYIRMYSIQRTSLEGTPNIRIVKDINIEKVTTDTVTFFDDGIIGSTFPAESLLFIGGEELIIGTIATKDNVLFGGDITLKRPSLEDVELQGAFSWEYDTVQIEEYNVINDKDAGLYPYKPYTLETPNILRHWKKGETYRFGIRAQYKTGIWSEVLYVGDYTPNIGYKTTVMDNTHAWLNHLEVSYIKGKYIIGVEGVTQLTSLGFKKAQLVYVPLSDKDRSIIGQGVITSTLGKVEDRMDNSPFAYPDYFTRGNSELKENFVRDWVGRTNASGSTSLEWEHFKPLSYTYSKKEGLFLGKSYKEFSGIFPFLLAPSGSLKDTSISKMQKADRGSGTTPFNDPTSYLWTNYKNMWFIDKNLLNLWSPEIDYGNIRHNLDGVNNLKIRGIANMTASYHRMNYSYVEGDTTSASTMSFNYSYKAEEVLPKTYIEVRKDNKTRTLSIPLWDYSKSLYKEYEDTDFSGLLGIVIESDNKHLYGEINKRKSSKFVYCGFNDMVINDDSSILLPISKPIYIDKDDTRATYDSGNKYDGFGGKILYNNHVNDISDLSEKRGVVNINYKANSHLLLNLKDSKYLPLWSAGVGNSKNYKRLNVPYYRNTSSTEHEFDTHYLDSSSLLGLTDSEMLNRNYSSDPRSASGYSYLFIVDILRPISVDLKYGGNTVEAIQSNLWIPAGEAVGLQDTNTLMATYGDTYIQRYDTLRVSNNSSETQETSEVLSVLLESYVNLDGRYDTKRGSADVSSYTTSNYAHVNDVYSQKNNLFTSNIIDYNKFKSDRFNYSILLSEPKKPNEFIDSWTSLWLNNTYDADGSLGKINKLVRFNDNLWGFQDKGIFQALYNSRVQIPVSDGVPIELSQSMKMDGVRYLSTSIGASNKWAIKNSNRALYFIDTANNDIRMMDEGLTNITETLGFKTWGAKSITTPKEYNLRNNRDAFVLNVDSINNDVYFNSHNSSLNLSESLNLFESFHSHEDIPWMFNMGNKFLSIKTGAEGSTIWENNQGAYNSYYGHKQPTYVQFYINPDPHLDKVFDNFAYRADVIDENNKYLAGRTFSTVEVWNEYQYGSMALSTPSAAFRNKKFRTWSFAFPRQRGTLNRIRNPWVQMKLNFNNHGNHKMYFHDMIITYNK